jgi:O-antigen ligase
MKYLLTSLVCGVLVGLSSVSPKWSAVALAGVLGPWIVYSALKRPPLAYGLALVLVTVGDGLGLPDSLRRIPALGGIALLLGAYLGGVTYGRRRDAIRVSISRPVIWTVLGFLAWGLVALPFVSHPDSALVYLSGMGAVSIAFLLIGPQVVKSEAEGRLVLILLALSTFVYAVLGLVIRNPAWPDYAVGLFPHPNYFGGVMMMGLPALLVLMSTSQVKWRMALLPMIFLVLGALAMSISRAAMGATVVFCGLYLLLTGNKRWGLAVVVVAALALLVVRPQLASTQVYQMVENKMARGLQGRDVLWDYYWDLARRHPITGIGAGGTANIIASNQLSVDLSPHNTYLRTTLEFGFPGVFLYLLFLAAVVRQLWMSRPQSKFGVSMRAAGLGLLAASTFSQFFESTIFGSLKYSSVYPLAYFALGFVFTCLPKPESGEVALPWEQALPPCGIMQH